MRTASKIGTIAAGALLTALGVGGGVIAGAATTPKVATPAPVGTVSGGADTAGGQKINDPQAKAPGYARNASGKTFGSAGDAPRPDLEPDLIWVFTQEGGEGYVYKTQLDGPMPQTKEEANALSAANASGRVITAYKEDGKTIVGTFMIGGAGDVAAAAAD